MAWRKAVLGLACFLVFCVPVSTEIGQLAQSSIEIDRSCDLTWRFSGDSPVALLSTIFGGLPAYVVRGTGSGHGDKVGDQIAINLYGNQYVRMVTERDVSRYVVEWVLVSGFTQLFQAERDRFELTSIPGVKCRVDRLCRAFTAEGIDLQAMCTQGLENLKAITEGSSR